jgi:thiamine-phosphate pyrophosphorylase
LDPQSFPQQPPLIARLHYITQEIERKGHLELMKEALDAGCDWVQLRVKDRPESEVLDLAVKARALTQSYGARLIVNDYPHVALAVDADGVHLGRHDPDPQGARDLLGEGYLIGGSANSIEDIERLSAAGVDYMGLGPFRFTETKARLDPVLGLEGYRRLMIQCRLKGLEGIPVIAIGGILLSDIRDLLHTGVHGVAISSLISRSPRKAKLVMDIQQLFQEYPTSPRYGAAPHRRKNL